MEELLEALVAGLNSRGLPILALEEPRSMGQDGGAWRLRVSTAEEGLPPTLVLKRAGVDWPWRWNDWAALAFLDARPGTRGLAPGFFAGDEGLACYLLEDLGFGQDLGAAALRPDARGRLAAGLLASTLAGLHAGAVGREEEWFGLRSGLPGAAPDRAFEAADWRSSVEAALSGLGLAGKLNEALDAVEDALLEPGPFLSLTHGRWDARGGWYGNLGARLLDFRAAAWRHCLLDLAAWEARLWPRHASRQTLVEEYAQEWSRLGRVSEESLPPALARARAFIGLGLLASGERSGRVAALLSDASAEPGLASLSRLESHFKEDLP